MARKSRRSLEAEQQALASADAHDGDAELEEGRGRTQRKNASKELTKLGVDLLALRAEKIAVLDLPERLLEALAEARRLTSFGAQRRQAQFIGKLMRKLDEPALERIRKALKPQ
jgi:ribosome-associated protein